MAILTVENYFQLCEHNLTRAKAAIAKGEVSDAEMFMAELARTATEFTARLTEIKKEGAKV